MGAASIFQEKVLMREGRFLELGSGKTSGMCTRTLRILLDRVLVSPKKEMCLGYMCNYLDIVLRTVRKFEELIARIIVGF